MQRPRVVPLIRQRVPAGVPEHVRMSLKAKPRLSASPFNHAGEAGRRKWRAAFRREHEGAFGLLFPLKPPQGA